MVLQVGQRRTMAFFDFGLMGGAELLRITGADYADSSISSLRKGRQQTSTAG